MSTPEKEIVDPEKQDITEPTDEEEIELTPEERCTKLQADLDALKQDNLRILADSENFKKRMTREKEEYCKFAASSILEEIIPVMDNLDLALSHGRQNEACKDLVLGVEMTMKIFLDTMKKHGLEQLCPENVPFDPTRHEAVGQMERDDLEENTVCQVLQKGYMLKERLLRPAKVMTSRRSS